MSLKEGLNDKILKHILRIDKQVVGKIRQQLEGDKPFASKPIPPEQLIYAKNNLGSEDLMDLVRDYGASAVNNLFYEITMMENRRKQTGTISEIEDTRGLG